MTTYHQCRFEQLTDEGLKTTTGWIEKRGAKVHALVELKGETGLWRVTSVSEGISEEEYKVMTWKSRRKLPSLKSM